MSGESFTDRMRAEAPTHEMSLEDLCTHAGVSAGALLYHPYFGNAIAQLAELGILTVGGVNVPGSHDEAPGWLETVTLRHPNLWEEVVGSLKFTESLCRLEDPSAPRLIKDAKEFVAVFGERDFSASGQVGTKRLT